MKDVKRLTKVLVIFIIISTIFELFYVICDEGSQYLNSIDYNITVNQDGSMNVVETWDINLYKTNTIFKTFNLDSTKYAGISNVNVKDLGTGEDLTQIDEYMYHVTKNCFYALNTKSKQFEIAWGTGEANLYRHKKYQISYVIEDIVTQYNDCQEIYWQLLGQGENQVPAKEVSITVNLYKGVSDLNNLKVWGHGQTNGTVEIVNNHQAKFELKNMEKGSRLEFRIITSEELFDVSNTNKIKQYDELDSALREEINWADTTKAEAEAYRNNIIFGCAIYIVIVLIVTIGAIKFAIIANKENDGIQKRKLEYFRDIPRDGESTPAEATYLYEFKKGSLHSLKAQHDAVTATILDLCLKNKITLRYDANNNIKVQIIGTKEGLTKDELVIYNLLKDVGGKSEFDIKEINYYAKKYYLDYSKSINKLANETAKQLYIEGIIDKKKEKLYKRVERQGEYKGLAEIIIVGYIWFLINHLILMIPLFKNLIVFKESFFYIWVGLLPLVISSTIKLNLKEKAGAKIAILTQKGYDEKLQWSALKRYLEDYSMIGERTVPELALWEKYLVFGTALGIADKVMAQMKANYPEVFIKENWNEDRMNQYPVLGFACNPIGMYQPISTIQSYTHSAYDTAKRETQKHYGPSSGSGGYGGGGGFSGGGGGRWWPVAGMGGR